VMPKAEKRYQIPSIKRFLPTIRNGIYPVRNL
jgi:hypothetical protein